MYLNQKNLYLNARNTHQQELIIAEIETLERERSRIAKDLHDSVGTNLTAIKMTTHSISRHDEVYASFLEDQLQSTIQEIKSIIYDLTPPGLERYGLVAGLKGYLEKIQKNLNFEIELNSFGPDIKDPNVSILSFRVIQELISNSLKHSNAKNIIIHINSFDDALNIVYEDNGRGFRENKNTQPHGSGLLNIESRVQAVKGTIQFETGEFGVSYIIDIPIKK